MLGCKAKRDLCPVAAQTNSSTTMIAMFRLVFFIVALPLFRLRIRLLSEHGDVIRAQAGKLCHCLRDSELRFRYASEQINVYAWEYEIATKRMRPCFRCMRDLGLPPLLENYPDSAIEMGIFPPEIADEYRDWIRRLEAGEDSIEGVLPLTVGRVPFIVRYTLERDETGKPLKAYGSAALVIDPEETK